MGLWSALVKAVTASPIDVIHANPLMILNDQDVIVFAGTAEIKVEHRDSNLELTVVEPLLDHRLTSAEPYYLPETMVVQTVSGYDALQKGNRGGDVYRGVDENGQPAIWLTGSAADAYILQRTHSVIEETP